MHKLGKKLWFYPLLIFLVALGFYSLNLAGQYYSLDEPGTIVVASSLKIGWYPSPWNGENFMSELGGAESTIHDGVYLWSWQPPLQNYIVYLSQGIWEESVFGARMLFVLLGSLSLVVFYFIARELFKHQAVIILLCIQLLLLMPYFLYIRQVRYYGPAALFSLIMLYVGIKVWKKTTTKWDTILISLAGGLLFLTNYLIWGSSVIALLPIAFYRKHGAITMSLLAQGILAALFLWWIKPQYRSDPLHANAGRPPLHIGIAKYLFYTNNYIFPSVLTPIFLLIRKTIPSVVIVLGSYIVVKILLYSLLLDAHGRYLMDLFPVFVLLTGYIYTYLLERRERVLLGVLFGVISLSNAMNIMLVYFVAPEKAILHFWTNDYAAEVTGTYPSAAERVGEYLAAREQSGDLFWSNNYRWYLYEASGVPMVSPMCDSQTGKFLGPASVTDPSRIRWFIFFRDDPRNGTNLLDVPCLGKVWQDKLQEEYQLVSVPGIYRSYLMNDPDIVGRKFPPEPMLPGQILVFERKQFYAHKKTQDPLRSAKKVLSTQYTP